MLNPIKSPELCRLGINGGLGPGPIMSEEDADSIEASGIIDLPQSQSAATLSKIQAKADQKSTIVP